MSVPSVSIEKGLDPESQEQDYVHTIYNEIASHFSQTRYKPWPIVEKFLKSRLDYSVGIDVGCGNGKYLGINEKLFIIGTDRSDGLIECAQGISSNYNVGVADGLNLPHPDNSLDFAISIAVIHHFATEERRIEAIAHILSKIKSGGEFLIYCWALEQENSRRGYKEGDDQDILIPWVLAKKQEKKPKQPRRRKQPSNEVVEKDDLKPELNVNETPENEPETKYRYYHLYKKGELVDNALRTKQCTIVEEGYEKDNWWVIVKKI
ncbi:S-adenosyl-L-methionine-dependent methyltransferase [Scheffersomyces amazonensis]|uniref:S-adenosyl-L-methionine-dependent methyltransferase n=1 Tax=Scheffersomyces amazonensis TaxID=1078765 RepID=UPI00315DE5DF